MPAADVQLQANLKGKKNTCDIFGGYFKFNNLPGNAANCVNNEIHQFKSIYKGYQEALQASALDVGEKNRSFKRS